mmetsp:Transcript_87867/g.243751  ORF Transcript_87867/g.243751 Transcript_87867/m.243751 type:complete len:266 (-) Transcript_87867:417-1214(-)
MLVVTVCSPCGSSGLRGSLGAARTTMAGRAGLRRMTGGIKRSTRASPGITSWRRTSVGRLRTAGSARVATAPSPRWTVATRWSAAVPTTVAMSSRAVAGSSTGARPSPTQRASNAGRSRGSTRSTPACGGGLLSTPSPTAASVPPGTWAARAFPASASAASIARPSTCVRPASRSWRTSTSRATSSRSSSRATSGARGCPRARGSALSAPATTLPGVSRVVPLRASRASTAPSLPAGGRHWRATQSSWSWARARWSWPLSTWSPS